ncbi:MAG: transglycosylase SLT domain-containing protein [Treponema sp.]|nr:transglycosylase SLT domain-containing protein [Treponema sp.]
MLTGIALSIYFCLPAAVVQPAPEVLVTEIIEEPEDDFSEAYYDHITEASFERINSKEDSGLTLYRQSFSRGAVEKFYTCIARNKDVALAILSEADKNDIPLSLAFALAYTESRYNPEAVNSNVNTSIDRGLFQLNSNSFPTLTEADFFDPYISAQYGMSHLKFCLNSAGNEVSALAMYNAGTGRVRSNKTPQSTLNYVGKIITYQKMLESLFADEVEAYYETRLLPDLVTTVAMADKR